MHPNMQTTLIILKPDCVQRGLMGKVISRFEEKGMQIVGAKLIQVDQALAAKHYEAHSAKPFFGALVEFITASPVLVLAVYGHHAIDTARKLMGATAGFKAEPGTIRGDYASSMSFNLVHGSDSPEAAERELSLFFKPEEIHRTPRHMEKWVIDWAGGKPQ